MIAIQTPRRCPRCGQAKIAELDFHRKGSGYASYCRRCVTLCQAEWRAGNRERTNATARRSYEKNPDAKRRYAQENKEKLNATKRERIRRKYEEKRLINPDLPVRFRSGTAKLNETKVSLIRQRLAAGESVASLAHAFGVHVVTIYAIRKGETWKDVI
jgi:transcription elongation factor Elf1